MVRANMSSRIKSACMSLSQQVQYIGTNGKLVTESFTDYTRKNLITQYPTIETFLTAWFNAERKDAIVAGAARARRLSG